MTPKYSSIHLQLNLLWPTRNKQLIKKNQYQLSMRKSNFHNSLKKKKRNYYCLTEATSLHRRGHPIAFPFSFFFILSHKPNNFASDFVAPVVVIYLCVTHHPFSLRIHNIHGDSRPHFFFLFLFI